MRTAHAISIGLALLAAPVACSGQPPPPVLTVTSPARGLVQSGAGPIHVTGTATPSASGDPVAQVLVNGVAARLEPSGAFSATIEAPNGAMLLETVATTGEGGSASDTRAVQSGQLRPVGAGISRAITAALSADAFTRLSAAAGPMLETMDLAAMLAPMQPMMVAGDDLANLTVAVTALRFRAPRISLTPVDGGLAFSATFAGLDASAHVAYGGALVPDGSTDVAIHADQITVTGTLGVTPAGTAGFATQLASPAVHTVGLRLSASGLAGAILDLLDSELGALVQSMVSSSAELAMAPLVTQALGALAGPQRIDVLGKTLELQVSPAAVTLSSAGAIVALDVEAMIEGSEASPGYIFTDNGEPGMDMRRGFQLGLADDLVNELLAEVHALGLLDLRLDGDYGLFDGAQFHLALPPMISASGRDGTMRLVIGDMKAAFTHRGATVVHAAINAQVDLQIVPAAGAREVALQFGHVDLRVDVLDSAPGAPGAPGDAGATGDDVSGATTLGLGIQLDSLSKLLITLPVPSVAGIQLEHLAIGADSGYVMVTGQIR